MLPTTPALHPRARAPPQAYQWGCCGGSIAYAFRHPQRSERGVVFWHPSAKERTLKYVKRLTGLAAAGELACLVTKVRGGGGGTKQGGRG